VTLKTILIFLANYSAYFGVVGCKAFKSHQDTMPMLPKTEARLRPTIPSPITLTIARYIVVDPRALQEKKFCINFS
jgi:hypothetical protein